MGSAMVTSHLVPWVRSVACGKVKGQGVLLQVFLSEGSAPEQCSFTDYIVAVSSSKSWTVGSPSMSRPASFSVLLAFLLPQGNQTCPCWACWSTQLRWKPTQARSEHQVRSGQSHSEDPGGSWGAGHDLILLGICKAGKAPLRVLDGCRYQ